jgi:hypothetical protein
MTPAPDCRCGHDKEAHESLAPQCSAPRCECLRYLPAHHTPVNVTAVAPTHTPAATVSSVDALLAAGRTSQLKRTVAFTEKITLLLHELGDRLDREHAAAQAKAQADQARAHALAEIARLEKQLAAAKAKLKTARHLAGLPGGERQAGDRACPDCTATFETAQRLGVHRRWHHGYRAVKP